MYNKLFWVVLEKTSITILNFLTIVIMGRLLSPSDYGIYGILYLFISIAETLIDSGFGGALVQKNAVQQDDINTLFYFNVLISIIAYILLSFFAPLIESYYAIENLAIYFRVISITLLFYSLSVVQVSILNRSLAFKKSAIINISAYLLSAIISIYLAYCGWGIWALIYQLIISSFLLALFYWIFNKVAITCSISIESLKQMWSFGSNTVAANIVQNLVNNITSSILPKISSPSIAGYFFQANRINNVPNSIIMQCVDKGIFPILSKEKDDTTIIVKARDINRCIATILIPLFPLLSLTAYPIIYLLLGESWTNASPYLAVLAWSGIALYLQGIYRNIIKSIGKTKYILYVEIIKGMLTILIILSTMRYGVMLMVYAFTISSYIGVFIWACILSKYFSYSVFQQFSDIGKPLFASIFTYITLKLCAINYSSLISLLVIPVGYILYLFISILFNNRETKRILSYCFSFLKKLI